MKKTLFLLGILLSLNTICLHAQEHSKAEKIILKPTGRYADLKLRIKGTGLWIDLNGNKSFDEGEGLKTLLLEKQTIALQDQHAEVTIYGEAIEKLIINDPEQDRQLYAIDLKSAPSLRSLDVSNNSLGELDLTACSSLEDVKAVGNILCKFDATGCTSLTQVKCSSNPGLKELILVDCVALSWLEAEHCAIETPFLRGAIALQTIFLDDNQLTALNIPLAASNLDLVSCSDNPNLRSFELRLQGKLNKLYVANCGLTTLNLDKAYALTELDCSRNELTELNLSVCSQLTSLKVFQNHIKAVEMKALVDKLNESEGSEKSFYAVNTLGTTPREANECPRSAVQLANDKKWNVFDYKGGEDPVLFPGTPDDQIPGGSSLLSEYVTIATSMASGETLTLEIKAEDPWVDLNGNGKKDGGERLEKGQNDIVIQDLKTLNVYGTNLETFIAVFAHITEANTSNAPHLKRLELNNNGLEQISLSANKHLEIVDLSSNKLKKVLIPSSSVMASLNVAFNELEQVDFLGVPYLKKLWVNHNKLTALKVNSFSRLEELYISENRINMLEMAKIVAGLNDISPTSVPKKRFFVVNTASAQEGNHISKSMIKAARDKKWTVFDFKDMNPNYEGEDDPVLGDKSQSIVFSTDRSAGKEISFYLKGEKCWIDLNGNGSCDTDEELIGDDSKTSVTLATTGVQTIYGAKITSLQINEMDLTELDLSQAPDLQKIWASRNKITTLKLGKADLLADMDLASNRISGSIDLSIYPELSQVFFVSNQISAINLGNLPKLTVLSLSENRLSTLNLSGCPKLKSLYVSDNQLTALDLSVQTEIQTVNIWFNKIRRAEMSKLVSSLHASPAQTNAGKDLTVVALDTQGSVDAKEENQIYETEVALAKDKKWSVLAWLAAGGTQEFLGITSVEQIESAGLQVQMTSNGWILQFPDQAIGQTYRILDFRGQLLCQGIISQNRIEVVAEPYHVLLCIGHDCFKLQR